MEKKDYNFVDFKNNESIIYFGQDVIDEYYKILESKNKRDNLEESYELKLIDEKLDSLIIIGTDARNNFVYDVEYNRIQSLVINNLPLKLQYNILKFKLDLFDNRLNYLKNIKYSLNNYLKREEEMQLKR